MGWVSSCAGCWLAIHLVSAPSPVPAFLVDMMNFGEGEKSEGKGEGREDRGYTDCSVVKRAHSQRTKVHLQAPIMDS